MAIESSGTERGRTRDVTHGLCHGDGGVHGSKVRGWETLVEVEESPVSKSSGRDGVTLSDVEED